MDKRKYPQQPILLVDDEPHTLTSFEIALRSSGINNTIRCHDSREVMAILQQQEIYIILLDLMMPFVSGQEILMHVSQNYPEIPAIIISGMNDLDTAVDCMRDGAFDYVSKPVNIDRLLPTIKHAIEVRRLRDENTRLSQNLLDDQLQYPDVFSSIITQNHKMRSIFRYCEAIGDGQTPVLITGETGSGKELIALALHKLSGRRGKLVTVNVAGVDENVFSDTLFGHVRGAYTGADRDRQGLIEKADNGTLFMDEIGDMFAGSQVKLLRFLEEREYFPIGSDLPKTSNARIIVATHEDIGSRIERGQFRKDLYYRLRMHHVNLPPLRERLEDIPLLLEHFLVEAAQVFKKEKPTFHDDLIDHLRAYHFPGNIREFRSMVFDAVSRHGSHVLSSKSFQENIRMEQGLSEKRVLDNSIGHEPWPAQLERFPSLKEAALLLINEAMRRTSNNQRAASLLLGITPQALNQRLKRM